MIFHVSRWMKAKATSMAAEYEAFDFIYVVRRIRNAGKTHGREINSISRINRKMPTKMLFEFMKSLLWRETLGGDDMILVQTLQIHSAPFGGVRLPYCTKTFYRSHIIV